MSTIQQLTFVKPKQFEWHEVASPKIDSGAMAIVKPLAVTRCDLDLYIANGAFAIPGPFAFGHEIAGEVIDIGDGVQQFTIGDRVIVPFQINCGFCDMCKHGYTNACTSVPKYSAYGLAPSSRREWGGGLSDLVQVPYADAMLVKIPDGMSLAAAAAISDNAADGYRTVAKPLAERPGADALIIGGLAQSVGLYAIQMAIALGSQRVVYCDFNAARLLRAKNLGAETIKVTPDFTIDLGEKFAVVVEAAGTPAALDFAIRSTEACGLCTAVSAGLETSANIPLRTMYMKGIRLDVGRVHARAAINDMLQCPKCQQVNTSTIMSAPIPFSQATEAMCEPGVKLVFTQE